MRISLKYAVWLLALMPLVQGCDEKKQTAQTQTLAPPIVDAPPPKPATVSPSDLPPPVIGDPNQNKPAAPAPEEKPVETPKKPVRRPKKPVTPTPAPATTTTPAQDAASTPPATTTPAPSVSAIGQLSGGASGDQRSEAEDTINATEKGINGITRTLNDAEVKTAAQIREFLKQAREALTTGDADAAYTLANKAKVLLTELNAK